MPCSHLTKLMSACFVSQHLNSHTMRLTSSFHEVARGLSALLGHGRVPGAVETQVGFLIVCSEDEPLQPRGHKHSVRYYGAAR